MSHSLIILGAGASYDYSQRATRGELSPLTNDLIKNRHLDLKLLLKYPGVNDIFSMISGSVDAGLKTFEQALTEIQQESEENEIIRRNLVSLEFYLQELFYKISTDESTESLQTIHQINNYRALIGYINRTASKKACVVSFNYDTLFERNISESARPRSMKDYVSGDIKIIKPHGSHDWAYVHSKAYLHRASDKSAFEIFYEAPHLLDEFKNDGRIPEHVSSLMGNTEYISFPAIAAPLAGKSGFICPPGHIRILEKQLSEIDRILIIGWRASDNELLDLLRKHIANRPLKILVVTGSQKGASEVIKALEKYLTSTWITMEAYDGGFSDFIKDDISRNFLL